jgi:hypothetical protein
MKKLIALLLLFPFWAFGQTQEMRAGSVVVGHPTGGNQGAGSVNMQSCYVNGVACGTGGGGTPAGSNGQLQYNNSGSFGAITNGSAGTCLLSNGASSAPSYGSCAGGSSNPAPNAQTGTTYTIQASDSGKLVTFSNTAAVAVTLPVASTFAAGFPFYAQNVGPSLVTLTPTTSTINGNATLTLSPNMGCHIVGDGTNYQTVNCAALNDPSRLIVLASNDTSGTSDAAHLATAFATIAATTRSPPMAGQPFGSYRVFLGPGTFWFTGSLGDILGAANNSKMEGLEIDGSGRDVTDLDYNPSVSGPFLINTHALNVTMAHMTVTGHDSASDFMWSQEQAGITNVQDYTFDDFVLTGNWNNGERLSGGNNNSEWRWNNFNFTAAVSGAWVYTPPLMASTMTSSSNSIAISGNTAEQIVAGDTGSLDAACAPLSANVQYYVVSATASTYQLSTTRGGSPVTFTANCTPNFSAASDQFLNFWFEHIKFDTGTSQGAWLTLNKGGHVHIHDFSIAGHASPSTNTCIFNLLGSTHAFGVMSFSASGGRTEILTDTTCVMHSQWSGGSILWEDYDESTYTGQRNVANVYATYEINNNAGPLIAYHNVQLMGTHNFVNNVSNFHYQNEVLYDMVTLQDQASPSAFITVTNNGNSGGYPRIHFNHWRTLSSSTSTGSHPVGETDLFWNQTTGGTTTVKPTVLLGGNSDWPFSGGASVYIYNLNTVFTRLRYSKPANGNSGAYNYSIQTMEATPTVLATFSGSNAGAAQSVIDIPLFFQCTTVLACTIEVIDNQSRSGTFTQPLPILDIIG